MPITIDRNKCNGCGSCIEECPIGTITIAADEKAEVIGPCVECGYCGLACPTRAIKMPWFD